MTQDAPVQTLRELLIRHRKRIGLTQKRLGELVDGISAGMIAQVEAGNRSLSRDSVDRVATALELTPAERNEFYLAREAASAALSERRPRTLDLSLTLGLAQIDAEMAALGPSPDIFDEPESVALIARRIALQEQRDRLTNRLRESDLRQVAGRLEALESKASITDSEVIRLAALVRALTRQVRRLAEELDVDDELPDDATPGDPEEGQSPQ